MNYALWRKGNAKDGHSWGARFGEADYLDMMARESKEMEDDCQLSFVLSSSQIFFIPLTGIKSRSRRVVVDVERKMRCLCFRKKSKSRSGICMPSGWSVNWWARSGRSSMWVRLLKSEDGSWGRISERAQVQLSRTVSRSRVWNLVTLTSIPASRWPWS